MRLFVNLSGSSVNELRFTRGPIYIGRQLGSQVFLADTAVSRQHAVFYTTKDGNWILDDLDSANKTFVNKKAVHKCEIQDGDIVQIADFSIEVQLQEPDETQVAQAIHAADTMAGIRPDLYTVIRQPNAADAPPIKMPARRVKDLSTAIRQIHKTKDLADLHSGLIDILFKQFAARDVWVALRKNPDGPMEYKGGKKITRETVKRLDLAVPQSLAEAIEKRKYILVHQLPREVIRAGIRSAIISPIVRDRKCYGAMYIQNSTDHGHYGLEHLDYLLLLSIQVAVVLERISAVS